MCAAHVSARCNLRDRDALEARLEEYKEGRAPCDLCFWLNWRCLLQVGQTLPNWPQWTAQRERRGKYVRGALRSLNSVLAMPSWRRQSPKKHPGQFSANQVKSKLCGVWRRNPRDHSLKKAHAAQCSGDSAAGANLGFARASTHDRKYNM